MVTQIAPKVQTVQVAKTVDFIYTPPPAALGAKRILVKPNLGYPVGPPVTVSMTVLGQVLQGLRTASPQAEILVVEGVCSPQPLAEIAHKNGLYSLLDEGMQLLNAEELPLMAYANQAPEPVRYKEMIAPQLLQDVDCRISVGAFKITSLKGNALLSASLKNLYGLFPVAKYKARSAHSRGQLHRPSVPQILQDVYFSIGHLFDGGVVDCDQKFLSPDWRPDRGKAFEVGQVIWGEDLLAVDQRACAVAGEAEAAYLGNISKLRAIGEYKT